MRKIILHMQLTADGYATGPNNSVDWFTRRAHDPELDRYNYALYANADYVLMGRRLYYEMETYWPLTAEDPEAEPELREFARLMNRIPKLVLSHTLDHVGWQECRLIKDDYLAELQALKAEAGRDMILAGGATTAREFIRAGLIDEYELLIHPVILGAGNSLFGGLEHSLDLELVETRQLLAGVVLLHYRVISGLSTLAA